VKAQFEKQGSQANVGKSLLKQGDECIAAGSFKEARLKFLEAITKDSDNTEAWFKAGLMYFCTDDHKQDPGTFITKAYKQKANNPALQAVAGFWLLTKNDRRKEGEEMLAKLEKDFFVGPLVRELRTRRNQLTPKIVKDLITEFHSYEEDAAIRTEKNDLQFVAETLDA
jgi:hypothetical protein